MKVYILVLVVPYEGDYIEGVYASADAAMASRPSKRWKQTGDGLWETPMGYEITAYDVAT